VTDKAIDRPRPPPPPLDVGMFVAVALELAMLWLFASERSIVGSVVWFAYIPFSATRALVIDYLWDSHS
jgi:hypothetical protein